MNIKKGFLTALAAVTAVTSVFAMTVSAAPLGDSTGNIDIINVTADGINKTNAIASIDISSGKRIYIRTTLPAKLSAGDYRLMISSVADKRTEDAFDTAVENTAKDIYEVTLQESDGNDVSVNNIEVVISETLDGLDTKPTESDTANVLYNKAFGIDGVTFADLNAKTSKDNITFETNGYSRFVLANVENTDIELPPEPTGEPISDISIPEVEPISNPISDDTSKGTNEPDTVSKTESKTESETESKTEPVPDSSTPSTPSNPNPSNQTIYTGDNTAAAMFAVICAASLGIVLASAKFKKASK